MNILKKIYSEKNDRNWFTKSVIFMMRKNVFLFTVSVLVLYPLTREREREREGERESSYNLIFFILLFKNIIKHELYMCA